MFASRRLVPLLFSFGLGLGVLSAPVHAEDGLSRVLVDVVDVVIHGGTPYYRHGNYRPHDRLIVRHDHHGRPIYYRTVYRDRGDDHHDRGHYGQPHYRTAYVDHGAYNEHRRANRRHANQHERQERPDHAKHARHDRRDHGRSGH